MRADCAVPKDHTVGMARRAQMLVLAAQPMRPLRAAKPHSWNNEYTRHGTRTLLASLDFATGKVIAHVRKGRKRTAVNRTATRCPPMPI